MQLSVHPFSEDLNNGGDAADGASTDTEFQSWIANGGVQMCVSSRVGDLKSVHVPSGAVMQIAGSDQTS